MAPAIVLWLCITQRRRGGGLECDFDGGAAARQETLVRRILAFATETWQAQAAGGDLGTQKQVIEPTGGGENELHTPCCAWWPQHGQCKSIKLMPLWHWHACMLASTFLLLIAAAGAAAVTPAKVCRTSSHGAEPSATRYATQQLQAAIDSCGDSCGRVVVDRPGAYLTASLRLSGCVHLELPAGVTLLAGSQVRSGVQRGIPYSGCIMRSLESGAPAAGATVWQRWQSAPPWC